MNHGETAGDDEGVFAFRTVTVIWLLWVLAFIGHLLKEDALI